MNDSLLTDEERMVRDMVRDWVEEVIPNIENACREGVFPDEWRVALGEMGVLGAPLKDMDARVYHTLPMESYVEN